jgi:hypothetical protein
VGGHRVDFLGEEAGWLDVYEGGEAKCQQEGKGRVRATEKERLGEEMLDREIHQVQSCCSIHGQ